jgi:hypothetical protein
MVTVIAIAGCATTPVPPSEASALPQDRLLAFQAKPQTPSGMLVITRDTGFIGGGCYFALWINGRLAARFGAGEKSTFFVPPGEVLLRVGRDPHGGGLCSASVAPTEWTQRETALRQDETKHFRLTIDANGKTDVYRSD